MTPDEKPFEPLTDREAAALRSLGGPVSPPRALEGRILDTLRDRGALLPPRNRPGHAGRAALLAAAAVAAFVVGRASGRPHPAHLGLPGKEFALLVLEEAAPAPLSPAENAGRVAAYRRWFATVEAQGNMVLGKELDRSAGQTLGPAGTARPETPPVAGMFVIRAPDLAGALALARTLPTYSFGGRVAVVPILQH